MARILVVDDIPEASDMLARLLRHLGHKVATADGGAEALGWLAAAGNGPRADLMLLDVMMPEVDGFAVLAAVRADPRTAGVPVVMFTAADDARLRARAKGAGAQGYLLKGRTSLDELGAAVERSAAAWRRPPPGNVRRADPTPVGGQKGAGRVGRGASPGPCGCDRPAPRGTLASRPAGRQRRRGLSHLSP